MGIIIPSFLIGSIWQRDSAYLNIRVNNDTTDQLQNEEQIVMNPTDTTNMVAVWRDFRLGYRQVTYAYTYDGGLTWEQDLFSEPQYIWDSDPGLTVDTAGNFYAVILSYNSTSEPYSSPRFAGICQAVPRRRFCSEWSAIPDRKSVLLPCLQSSP